MMKRWILLCASLLCVSLWLIPAEEAEAYWGYRRYRRFDRSQFQPRFSLSVAGGIHFVDVYGPSDRFAPSSEDYTFAFANFELGGHLWIHPNLSLDLGLGSRFVLRPETNSGMHYFTFKPGIRARMRIFYFRAALDLTICEENQRHDPILLGFLLGVGIRVPVNRNLRFFAEINYQALFAAESPYFMPFYGQLGLEFMF